MKSRIVGSVAVVFLVVPIVVVPTTTSTIVSAWIDRAADAERLNLQDNRPEVQESAARIADYYRQRGVENSDLGSMTAAVLAGSVKEEAGSQGIQVGLRFLSLIVGGMGLLITALLARSSAPIPT